MHVGSVFFKHLNRAQRCEVLYAFRFEGVAIVSLKRAGSEVIFCDACIIFLWLYHFTGQFNAFILLVLESVDVDHSIMDQHANCIAVGCVRVGAINISFKNFWVFFADIF